MSLTAAERTMRARIAAYTSWAHTPDRAARTAKARAAAAARFEQLADPEGVLTPAERAKRAEALRRAHYQQMAFKSAQARRQRATA